MKPTLAQKFFASKWPLSLWFASTSLGTVLFLLNIENFNLRDLSDWNTVALYLLLIVTSAALGFMFGAVGSGFIGRLFHWRALVNGGPFKPGDRVQIIGGTHDGVLTHVYSGWQGASLRVDLGDEAKEKFQDIFFPAQLLRVSQNDPRRYPDDSSTCSVPTEKESC
jgi:hypothetical protein